MKLTHISLVVPEGLLARLSKDDFTLMFDHASNTQFEELKKLLKRFYTVNSADENDKLGKVFMTEYTTGYYYKLLKENSHSLTKFVEELEGLDREVQKAYKEYNRDKDKVLKMESIEPVKEFDYKEKEMRRRLDGISEKFQKLKNEKTAVITYSTMPEEGRSPPTLRIEMLPLRTQVLTNILGYLDVAKCECSRADREVLLSIARGEYERYGDSKK